MKVETQSYTKIFYLIVNSFKRFGSEIRPKKSSICLLKGIINFEYFINFLGDGMKVVMGIGAAIFAVGSVGIGYRY
jgi:hypothetical protein